MCTVTVVRDAAGLRVACNRDESRQRREAHPPHITRAGRLLVLTPQDPDGGGTWIAANSAGLVFALLNVHTGERSPGGVSRGRVIPMLVEAESLDDAVCRMVALPVGSFAPFRLVVADDEDAVAVRVVNGIRDLRVLATETPLLFTSSSLGDALVDGPRRALFEQMVERAAPRERSARQDAFHAHRWRDRPAVSVHMSRPDACTVSTTIVETTPREVRMVYHQRYCDPGTPVGLIIDRREVHDDASRRTRGQHAAV